MSASGTITRRAFAGGALALVLGGTGLIIVLIFAHSFKLDPGTASGMPLAR